MIKFFLAGAAIAVGGRRRAWRRCVTFATFGALPGVLALSILDWLIGPS
jgi:hypothetical protein